MSEVCKITITDHEGNVVKERDAAVFDLGHAAFVPQICKHYDVCELVDSDGDRG